MARIKEVLERRLGSDGLLIFLFAFLVFEISINSVWATDHTISFMKLDYALLTSHSPALGQVSSVPPWTVDDFLYKGQNYSALAPGTAILALPFMALAYNLAGGFTAYGPALLLSETFVSLTGAVAAYLVYKIASLYFMRPTAIFLGFAFAFSTICWPFATYFFQSDVSAMFVLAAAYFALRAGRAAGGGTTLALLSGLAMGMAFTVDYVNLVIIPILIVFVVVKKNGSRRSMAEGAVAFILGALPGLAVIGAYNLAIFGSPFASTEATYLGRSLLGEFSTPILNGLALDTVSLSRGIFVFAPFTVLGIMGLADALRAKGSRAEMLLFLAIFLGIVIPYSAWYDPVGGISFGPRFLVAAIPFLIIPAGFVVEQAKGLRTILIYAVFVVGAIVNGLAAFVTAIPPVTPSNVSPFTSYILPNLLKGNLDSLWAAYLGQSWPVAAALVVALGVVLPLAFVETAKRWKRVPGTHPGPIRGST